MTTFPIRPASLSAKITSSWSCGRWKIPPIAMLAFEVEPDELDKVEQVFSENGEIVKLDDHAKYRSRIVEDPDGHAIEFYANK